LGQLDRLPPQDVVVLKWKDLLNTTCKLIKSASVKFYRKLQMRLSKNPKTLILRIVTI
jgi:hypothetical protein